MGELIRFPNTETRKSLPQELSHQQQTATLPSISFDRTTGNGQRVEYGIKSGIEEKWYEARLSGNPEKILLVGRELINLFGCKRAKQLRDKLEVLLREAQNQIDGYPGFLFPTKKSPCGLLLVFNL